MDGDSRAAELWTLGPKASVSCWPSFRNRVLRFHENNISVSDRFRVRNRTAAFPFRTERSAHRLAAYRKNRPGYDLRRGHYADRNRSLLCIPECPRQNVLLRCDPQPVAQRRGFARILRASARRAILAICPDDYRWSLAGEERRSS